MTLLEKIKRCVSLVWDFQEIYGEEDIEDFCHNELHTYLQHDEIMEYFKHIENLEKANEWHYVKDGDLPKDGETVLVCRDDIQIWTGNRHSKRENSYFWYVHNLHGVMYKDSDIYAWKEIVLPKKVEE